MASEESCWRRNLESEKHRLTRLNTKMSDNNNNKTDESSSSTCYMDINLSDEFRNRELVNSRLVKLFSKCTHQPPPVVNNNANNTTSLNADARNSRRFPSPLTTSTMKRNKSTSKQNNLDFPFDQIDHDVAGKNEMIKLDKDDYIHIANRYKSLCQGYKDQLTESQKMIESLRMTVKNLEKSLSQAQKRNLTKSQNETEQNHDHRLNTLIDRCKAYCDKINQYSKTSDDCSDSGCATTTANERGDEATVDSSDQETNRQRRASRKNAECVLKTLQHVVRERKEIKNFMKTFESLVQHLHPSWANASNQQMSSFAQMNQAAQEIIDIQRASKLNSWSPRVGGGGGVDFDCCGNTSASRGRIYEYEDTFEYSTGRQMTSRRATLRRSQSSAANSMGNHRVEQKATTCTTTMKKLNGQQQYAPPTSHHRPSEKFLVEFLRQFLNLFDVSCFLNAPTRLNHIYYKHGKLVNFKKAIQNIIDPDTTYSNEKLVFCVQTLHDRLNTSLSDNLKKMLKTNNLERVIDEFKMYDEYFPRLLDLIESIMDALDVSRVDNIVPSIRALQLVAEPVVRY